MTGRARAWSVSPGRADDPAGGRRARPAGRTRPDGVVDRPPARWGLAARGALVEAGGPALRLRPRRPAAGVDRRRPRLYAQAAAAPVGPGDRHRLDAPRRPPGRGRGRGRAGHDLPGRERAGGAGGAGPLPRPDPPPLPRGMQLLAVQVADEARHIEVFTRRALLRRRAARAVGRRRPGVAGHPAGRAGLRPRLVPAVGARRGHLPHLLSLPRAPRPRPRDPAGRAPRPRRRGPPRRLRDGPPRAPGRAATRRCAAACGAAVERRHDALADTAGLNEEVFDALVVLAAGAWAPEAIADGYAPGPALQADMDEGRQRRLVRLGFPPGEAAALSALHTRNFM